MNVDQRAEIENAIYADAEAVDPQERDSVTQAVVEVVDRLVQDALQEFAEREKPSILVRTEGEAKPIIDALTQKVADAWDEGYAVGRDEHCEIGCDETGDNPYRSDGS